MLFGDCERGENINMCTYSSLEHFMSLLHRQLISGITQGWGVRLEDLFDEERFEEPVLDALDIFEIESLLSAIESAFFAMRRKVTSTDFRSLQFSSTRGALARSAGGTLFTLPCNKSSSRGSGTARAPLCELDLHEAIVDTFQKSDVHSLPIGVCVSFGLNCSAGILILQEKNPERRLA